MTLNPNPTKNSVKEEFAELCITPFIVDYINTFNHSVDKQHSKAPKELALRKCLSEYITKHRLKSIDLEKLSVDYFLEAFSKIPRRGVGTTIQLHNGSHLNFRLLWAQMALIDLAEASDRSLFHIIVKPTDRLLKKAVDSFSKPNRQTTVIKELLRNVCYNIPDEVCFWSVLEKGKIGERYHIHIIVALTTAEKTPFRNALHEFDDVQFFGQTKVNGQRTSIDMGASGYLAKETNNRYFESNNVFISSTLKPLLKDAETLYKSFIEEHRENLLKNDGYVE